jgi:hypothetical protein
MEGVQRLLSQLENDAMAMCEVFLSRVNDGMHELNRVSSELEVCECKVVQYEREW